MEESRGKFKAPISITQSSNHTRIYMHTYGRKMQWAGSNDPATKAEKGHIAKLLSTMH